MDREWAVNNLLKDVSKQRKVVPDSDSRRQLAWVRAAYTADNQSHRCILLGLLFQPALVVKIFDVAIASLDEGLMRTASMGLVAINDIFAGLDSGECVKVAELALSVGVSPLHWLHSELINVLGAHTRFSNDGEKMRFRLLATEHKFYPELSDKAQVLIRIANRGRVQVMKEQDLPAI